MKIFYQPVFTSFNAATACFSQSKILDDYLQQAVKNSPLIKDLNNQILSAQLDSVRIRAGF
jgi:hypothetical protein